MSEGDNTGKERPHAWPSVRKGLDAYRRRDYALALEMLRDPATYRGHALAQLTLGLMYYDGFGVPQDHREAARWLRMAVDFGEASGLAEVMLADIDGAERARLGAEQGDVRSMRDLGICHGFGFGVPRDLKLAYMWFRLATLHGCDQSSSSLASVSGRLTASEREQAECSASQWRPRIRY